MHTAASQVKSLIRRILHLPMSSDTALLHLLNQHSPNGRATACLSTKTFYLTFCSSCSTSLLDPSAPHRKLLYSARIGAAHLMKGRSGSQHEYIIASVFGLVGGRARRRSPDSLAGSISSVGSSNTGIPAMDQITIYNDGYDSFVDVAGPKGCAVFSIDFLKPGKFEEAPSLLNLAVAASMLTDGNPSYELLRKQCYWYSGVLLRAVAGPRVDDLTLTAQELVPVPGDDHAQATQNFMHHKDVPKGGKVGPPSGTFRTFRTIFKIITSDGIEAEFGRLAPDYQKKVTECEAKLQKLEDKGNVSALLEEQVKEERKKTATAEARVEEEARKTAAAEARAKALEEQLRALQAQHAPNA
ncbi:hypothetical protein C8Q78DRAFT_428426 [Trametes maxima]|nr:hypothetical protein C8Q78DRAFT_428426 [Trametes maxima]